MQLMLPELITIISRLFVLVALAPAAGPAMERVTLKELETATGGRAIACNPTAVSFDRVTIDSRTARPGDLFWALEGTRHDGHDFVGDAVSRGAVACVVQENKASAGNIPAVVVPDALQGLQDFARSQRQRMDALAIGVTGSVGKTTTREMIFATLSPTFDGCRSPKNFNNQIGVPLTVLDIESRHEFAVLELAASRRGEIRELASIAQPEVGVLTSIGAAHLASFGTIESVAATKAELLESLPPAGFAVINGDDPRCRAASSRARCRVISVGECVENDLCATAVESDGQRVRFRVDGASYQIPAVGRHHVVAGLAAIAIARELGVSPAAIAEGLSRFEPVAGRCKVRQRRPWALIDDTYNANPSSVEAACRLLSEWKGSGRRILVLGDMLELGVEAAVWHTAIGQYAARHDIDGLVVLGQHAADVLTGARAEGMASEQIAHCDDLEVVDAVLGCWLEPGDVVLVKGSRSMQMERVVERLIAQTNIHENIAPCVSTRACA
jgi:UDP-N-acetylmuramoyl-tripeptide--D-alanyl-D-alanine ligase